jgi:hypothetical protein
MRPALSAVVVLVGVLAAPRPARADDAEDLKEAKDHFEGSLKAMNERCKTHITATYDLSKEKYERERYDGPNKKWIYEPNRESGQFRLKKGWGYSFCGCALDGIAGHCDKDTFKELLAAKVKTITCEPTFLTRYEQELRENREKNRKVPAGMDEWEVSIAHDAIRHEYKDGVLSTFVDSDGANCGQYSSVWVPRKLGFEEQEHERESKGRFDEALAKMNEKCGTKITATYALDKEFYQRERYDGPNKKWFMQPNDTTYGQFTLHRGWGYDQCACAFSGIMGQCDKDTFKEMIAKKVKTIECESRPLAKFERELHDQFEKTHKEIPGYMLWEYYPSQMDSFRHEYKDGVLKTLVDPDGSNCGTYTSRYVTTNLGFKEDEQLKVSKERFEEKLAKMNEQCGTHITASYDLSTEKYERERYDSANKKWFLKPNDTGGQWRLWKGWGYDICTCAFEGIARGCDKDSYKAALAKAIKSVKCEMKFLTRYEQELTQKYQKARKPPAGMETWEVDGQQEAIRHEYKKGVLTTFVDSDAANCGQYTAKYLTRKVLK